MGKFCNKAELPDYAPRGEGFNWVRDYCDEPDCEGCGFVAQGKSRIVGHDRIKVLTAELTRLREALKIAREKFTYIRDSYPHDDLSGKYGDDCWHCIATETLARLDGMK